MKQVLEIVSVQPNISLDMHKKAKYILRGLEIWRTFLMFVGQSLPRAEGFGYLDVLLKGDVDGAGDGQTYWSFFCINVAIYSVSLI